MPTFADNEMAKLVLHLHASHTYDVSINVVPGLEKGLHRWTALADGLLLQDGPHGKVREFGEDVGTKFKKGPLAKQPHTFDLVRRPAGRCMDNTQVVCSVGSASNCTIFLCMC